MRHPFMILNTDVSTQHRNPFPLSCSRADWHAAETGRSNPMAQCQVESGRGDVSCQHRKRTVDKIVAG